MRSYNFRVYKIWAIFILWFLQLFNSPAAGGNGREFRQQRRQERQGFRQSPCAFNNCTPENPFTLNAENQSYRSLGAHDFFAGADNNMYLRSNGQFIPLAIDPTNGDLIPARGWEAWVPDRAQLAQNGKDYYASLYQSPDQRAWQSVSSRLSRSRGGQQFVETVAQRTAASPSSSSPTPVAKRPPTSPTETPHTAGTLPPTLIKRGPFRPPAEKPVIGNTYTDMVRRFDKAKGISEEGLKKLTAEMGNQLVLNGTCTVRSTTITNQPYPPRNSTLGLYLIPSEGGPDNKTLMGGLIEPFNHVTSPTDASFPAVYYDDLEETPVNDSQFRRAAFKLYRPDSYPAAKYPEPADAFLPPFRVHRDENGLIACSEMREPRNNRCCQYALDPVPPAVEKTPSSAAFTELQQAFEKGSMADPQAASEIASRNPWPFLCYKEGSHQVMEKILPKRDGWWGLAGAEGKRPLELKADSEGKFYGGNRQYTQGTQTLTETIKVRGKPGKPEDLLLDWTIASSDGSQQRWLCEQDFLPKVNPKDPGSRTAFSPYYRMEGTVVAIENGEMTLEFPGGGTDRVQLSPPDEEPSPTEKGIVDGYWPTLTNHPVPSQYLKGTPYMVGDVISLNVRAESASTVKAERVWPRSYLIQPGPQRQQDYEARRSTVEREIGYLKTLEGSALRKAIEVVYRQKPNFLQQDLDRLQDHIDRQPDGERPYLADNGKWGEIYLEKNPFHRNFTSFNKTEMMEFIGANIRGVAERDAMIDRTKPPEDVQFLFDMISEYGVQQQYIKAYEKGSPL